MGKTARERHNDGADPSAILDEIAKITGPPPARFDPPPVGSRHFDADAYRRYVVGRIADLVQSSRKRIGDRQSVHYLISWTEAPVPRFRRL